MIGADYICKLQRDYPIVCALLEKEPSLPEGPSEPAWSWFPPRRNGKNIVDDQQNVLREGIDYWR